MSFETLILLILITALLNTYSAILFPKNGILYGIRGNLVRYLVGTFWHTVQGFIYIPFIYPLYSLGEILYGCTVFFLLTWIKWKKCKIKIFSILLSI